MPWVKLDDGLSVHQKTEALIRDTPTLGLAAFGLHTLALCHCSRHLTDGFVDAKWVARRLQDARITPARGKQVTTALVNGGQWAVADHGWVIHDFLEHNPSRQEVLEKRAADAERKRKGGSARNPGGIQPDSGSPVPSRPVPTSKANPESEAATPMLVGGVVVEMSDLGGAA